MHFLDYRSYNTTHSKYVGLAVSADSFLCRRLSSSCILSHSFCYSDSYDAFIHAWSYIHWIQWATFMNELRSKSEREKRSKVKSWVNERICTRWVRLAASRRLTRISCRRQQSAATTKQRDEIKEENVIRCDFLLLKPQSVYEDLAFVGCDRVQSRMKTKNRRLYIHRMMLWGSEWEGNENLSFKFISIVVISSYSNLGTKGFWLFAHRKLLRDDLKPLEMKSPTQIVTNFNLMTMTTMLCYQYITSPNSSWSLIGCKWDDRFRIN